MFLMTADAREIPAITERLETDRVDYHLQSVSPTKTNLFFGRQAMVATVREVVTKPLNRLSPEEDFILGTLLGYDREEQCRRYLTKCGADSGVGAWVCPPEGCEDCPAE